MAPTPQEVPSDLGGCVPERSSVLGGNRVVISGVSGCYPQSHHIQEFSDILYNKVNPAEDKKPRWNYDHPEVPQHVGLIPDLDTFDAQFFRVHYHLGVNLDPMSRKILEHAYQAIYDAGVNPSQLSGKKVGVYIGSCLSETEKALFYAAFAGKTGFSIAGCSKTMFANRVSYWLNVKGPSQAIDGGCCSSAVSLEQAYQALTRGDCEAALVGGCNLCMHPQTSIHFSRNIKLCMDGRTKSYDQEADGCVKSEAISVLFLQNAKDALRIYADVVFAKTAYASVENTGSFKRKPEEITRFLQTFYDEIKVSPSEVEFVEGFGAADIECDKTELDAIDKVFCTGRREPLHVGSVMSNIGYCESASGIMGVTKVLLGYHTGQLAGNLHCERPRDDVAALREGRLKILSDHKPTARTYVAVNGLSLSGVNSHILLHGHYKPKDLSKYHSKIPRLVLISGRTDSAVQSMINNLKSRPIDAEELALIQNIHSYKINGHVGRGYTILDTDGQLKTTCLCEKAEYFDRGERRPLWFVYSGMGSQWAGMGTQLMRLPIFAAAIERCRRVLEPKGIDIVHIITSPDKTIYDNILHSFVGIAAVQIGLTDVLLQLGLVPDKIIGHSVGELGCAYADGCLTAEEMILSAYSRGLVSVETPFIHGSMAAVGIGFTEVAKMCPPEIEVACHNATDSSTISGPAEIMTQFVAQLTAKKVFAKEVPCSNIAYHSRYIAEAGPGLLKYLKEVIKTPRLRGERWVSTSVPQDKWNDEMAKYSSAEYHTNNLLNPVLFEETSRLIPKNAVLVEVAPHGLLQAILKRAMPACVNVPLTRRGHPDNTRFLLEAIGQLFMEGYYPDIRPLYPKVEFPVSTGTPHLSHLVEWAHQQKWHLALYSSPERISASTCTFKITLHDAEHAYLRGHRIRGKTLFPFSSALVCVWDTLTMVANAPRQGLPVEFRDVELCSQPILHDMRLLRLTVAINRGNGRFEIDDGITKVASGYIVLKNTVAPHNTDYKDSSEDMLRTEEIYQILNERGYMYRDDFKAICEANESFSAGVVSWTGRWEPFLDALLQLNMLRQPHDHVSKPAFIGALSINTNLHTKSVQMDQNLKVKVCAVQDRTRCGGVTIKGIKFRHISKPDARLIFDTSKFDPRYQAESFVNGDRRNNAQNENMLRNTTVGDLESLHWVTAPASQCNGISIKVHFAGLNATDILTANDANINEKADCEGYYGMDFSGKLQNGTRVMGIVHRGSARSRVRAHPDLLWPVPAHWSLEEAATVPLPYAHALYCLVIKTRLLPRTRVLVSGGAGATGMAIITMALHLECRVFVVVGDAAKKKFLLKMFPKLNADDIICCRDDSFVNRVLPATDGRGCEYVICGKGDHKDAYLQCCTHFGYTLDIHQVKNNESFSFRMAALSEERCYMRVDFSGLFLHNDIKTLKRLQYLVAEGISGGWVRPLSRVVYAPSGATRAFRLLARSGHRGRVLLRINDLSTPLLEQRLTCSNAHCQLVISDTLGLAVRLASRLVQRGARALHLQLAHIETRLNRQLQSWRKLGVNVTTSSLNLTQNDCASNLLKLCSVLGPVESIFVAMAEQQTGQTQAIYKSLLANLDAETRKKCPSLKYFTVVGVNTSVGVNICISRAAYRLPAMMLSISMDTTKVKITLPTSYEDIVNATEQGLQTMQPVIYAQHTSDYEDCLLQQIEKISGINLTETTFNKQSLQDLGLTVDKIEALRVFLYNHNIAITETEVLSLSIEKIREMEVSSQETDYASVHGLSAFFPFVDTDELLATIDTVVMPTLTQGSDMRDDEFKASESCLYILPGLQGLHQRYRELCERLKLAAVVLQPGLDHPEESLEELTARYISMFLKKRGDTNKFYLLGHELGVLSVLEMAAVLEDHGMTGTVFCLGGGPEDFLDELERQILVACSGVGSSQMVLQEAVARHMCALMGVTSPKLDATLHDAATWQQKVEASVRALRGRVAHSTQYARMLIEAAYARVIQARQYARPAPRAIQSRIVLLRSSTPSSNRSSLDLQRYSRVPLVVHDLRSPPAHATNDLRAAAIINRYLDEETTQSFAKKTLCHTYLMNPESFIGIGDFEEGSKIKL